MFEKKLTEVIESIAEERYQKYQTNRFKRLANTNSELASYRKCIRTTVKTGGPPIKPYSCEGSVFSYS